MMQFLLLFVHILFLETSVSVASQDLFSNDAPIDENPVDGLDLGPMPLEDSGNIAQQASILDYDSNISPNTNLWDLSDKSPVSFETSGDEGNNMDLLASGCLSNDRLGARDGQTSCDNPNKDTIPHIPTFEEMMGAVSALQATQEDKVCFPPRPFHLCCLCGGFTGFGLCEECIIYTFAECLAPYIEVCCKTMGVYWRSPGWTNLDDWTNGEETMEEYREQHVNSEIAEDCVAVPF